MIRLVFLTLILFIAIDSIAQKNSLEIGLGRTLVFNVQEQNEDKIQIASARYTRRISEHLAFYVQYSRSPLNSNAVAYNSWKEYDEDGNMFYYYGKYNYLDFAAQYEAINYKAHRISVSAGPSVAFGKNTYFDNMVIAEPNPGEPYGHIIFADLMQRNAFYFGAAASVRYDYSFWKSKFNVGPDISLRYFFNGFPAQLNYGLHLGFNF